jgi:hypothetical protein
MDSKKDLSKVLKIKADIVRLQVEVEEVEARATDDTIITSLSNAREHLFSAQRCLDRLNRFS